MSAAFWRPLAPSPERDRLLEAVLNHVPFDGWSPAALKAAAGDLGLTLEEAEREFPGGALDLIGYHSVRADRQMGEAVAALECLVGPQATGSRTSKCPRPSNERT